MVSFGFLLEDFKTSLECQAGIERVVERPMGLQWQSVWITSLLSGAMGGQEKAILGTGSP